MDIYIKLFEVLFPVFFIIGIGYFLGKKDPKINTNFITKFTANIIGEAISLILQKEILVKEILICGGGIKNKVLLKTNSNDDYEIFYYLGASKYNLDEFKSAIPYFKKSLIINPNNKFAIYLLGQSYIALGDKKESKRQLRLLMNIDDSLFDTLKLAFNSKFDLSMKPFFVLSKSIK